MLIRCCFFSFFALLISLTLLTQKMTSALFNFAFSFICSIKSKIHINWSFIFLLLNSIQSKLTTQTLFLSETSWALFRFSISCCFFLYSFVPIVSSLLSSPLNKKKSKLITFFLLFNKSLIAYLPKQNFQRNKAIPKDRIKPLTPRITPYMRFSSIFKTKNFFYSEPRN